MAYPENTNCPFAPHFKGSKCNRMCELWDDDNTCCSFRTIAKAAKDVMRFEELLAQVIAKTVSKEEL